MRFPPIAPQELAAEQRPLYDDMKAGINAKYNLFTTMRADVAVVSDRVRQIAILVMGARFDARYELYAHAAVASKHGLSDQFISTLVSGNRPGGMADDEGLTYEVAHSVSSGRRLLDDTYRRAITLFGQRRTNELIYLVYHYCFVSVTLNRFDIPVPSE
jgi:4-carboxymuconolactone decarboxylase